jgi:hypothetical protein
MADASKIQNSSADDHVQLVDFLCIDTPIFGLRKKGKPAINGLSLKN